MKVFCILASLAVGLFSTQAQEITINLSDIIDGVQQFAQENLDTNFLNSLPEFDDQQVRDFFRDIEQRFQGEYVVDLAPLKQAAIVIMPLLESREETRPYVPWLKAQLDYLDVAEEFTISNAPPKVEPGQPPRPIPNPPPAKEREVWVRKVANRPWPPTAKNYVTQLKPIFAAQKIPPELIWIAEVESSFDARARSPAGAAGLFQLMPATAKRFGLSTFPFDERLQPAPSANASAQYLKFLHDKFKDWRLALAAYNAGEGTVQKLLDRYKAKSYDAIATHLPAETQMYVPKVEAILQRREGVKLAEL